MASNWAITDTITIMLILKSYSMPINQLPKNQKMPKENSNIPYPDARLFLGINFVTMAFNIDSWAPMPMPHKTIPINNILMVFNEKMKIEKTLESKVEIINAFILFCHINSQRIERQWHLLTLHQHIIVVNFHWLLK